MNRKDLIEITKNGFNGASEGYDNPALRFFDKSAEHLIDQLSLTGNENLLDVATGTGRVALVAAQKLHHGKVIGFDLSEGMIQRAQTKAQTMQLTNVEFSCHDAHEVEFPKESFDVICCGFGVFFWPEMETVLQKLKTFLKPNGRFAMTSFSTNSFEPQSGLCLKRFERYGVKLPETYTWLRLDHPQKHFDLLNQVGFRSVETHSQPMGYLLKDSSEWWDIVRYSGFRAFLNQLSDEQIAHYQHEHLKEIEQTSDEHGIKLNVEVIFSVGQK